MLQKIQALPPLPSPPPPRSATSSAAAVALEGMSLRNFFAYGVIGFPEYVLPKDLQASTFAFNLVLCNLWRHPENVELGKVKVFHYCAFGSKPWRYSGKEENMDREYIKMLVEKWWDIYNDKSLDFESKNAVVAEEETLSKSTIMASIPEPRISFIII